jgi:chromosome partitioning protein
LRRWLPAPRQLAELKLKLAKAREELDSERGKVTALHRLLDERLEKEQGKLEAVQSLFGKEKAKQRERVTNAIEMIKRLKKGNDNLRQAVDRANTELRKAQEKSRKAAGFQLQLNALLEQMKQVDHLQGKIWERPIGPSVPAFRPLLHRAAPILAVVNLKGGVGKTSLTANLAATFAAQGKRVLIVDLDYQGSLTQLCMPLETFQELQHTGDRFVQDVLKAKSEFASLAWRNTVGINNAHGGNIRMLATDENLADVEEYLKAHWLLNPTSVDVRFLLRAALHEPPIQGRFDLILLDCPPRLSTACVNALTCCDAVLIPVILDRVSTEAVPRLLAWLYHLKFQERLCPDLSVLGVVANRTQKRPRLTTKETGVWEDLQAKSKVAWSAPVYHFERFIPSSQYIADAASRAEFAAHHKSIGDLFEQLADEVERRLNHHESGCPVAAVP